MSNTATTSTAIDTQPKTAKEVIAANVQSLIEQLEAGQSDALTAYLNAMSRFHNYTSATFSKSHGRRRTQPESPGSGSGRSLAAA